MTTGELLMMGLECWCTSADSGKLYANPESITSPLGPALFYCGGVMNTIQLSLPPTMEVIEYIEQLGMSITVLGRTVLAHILASSIEKTIPSNAYLWYWRLQTFILRGSHYSSLYTNINSVRNTSKHIPILSENFLISFCS
jgi:hypothetical protein